MQHILDILIIGGGAAGLMTACAAAQIAERTCVPVHMAIVERNDRVGRKILSTGNGRCNLANTDFHIDHFHSEALPIAAQIMQQCTLPDILRFFKRLGLYTVTEANRIYPASRHASAVLDVLRLEIERRPINIWLNTHIVKLQKDAKKNLFYAYTADKAVIVARKVVITTGGCAAPATGSDGDGFQLLSQLGHAIYPAYPALVPLVAEHSLLKSLKGLRVHATLALRSAHTILATETGELMFTEYGLSGIPAMQLAGYLNGHVAVTGLVDFFPEMRFNELVAYLQQRRQCLSDVPMENFFTGLLHKQVGRAIMILSGTNYKNHFVSQMTHAQLTCIASLLKGWELPITGTKGFAHAQATGGGADLAQFNPTTLQSICVPGLYAAGEVLDIYGDCGGYNLQWAWSSGIVAGKNAALPNSKRL